MEYNLKKFEGRNARLENRLTITKSFSVGFPQKFYQDNEIKTYKYVVLYWDSESKVIGINFTNNEQEKSKFSIIHSKIGYGGSIATRSFLKTNKIDPNIHHGRYEWEKIKIDDTKEVFIVKLDKAKFI
jgi:hypothetical protein